MDKELLVKRNPHGKSNTHRITNATSQYTRSRALLATLEMVCSLIVNAWQDALILSQSYADADHTELAINLDMASRLAHRLKEEQVAA